MILCLVDVAVSEQIGHENTTKINTISGGFFIYVFSSSRPPWKTIQIQPHRLRSPDLLCYRSHLNDITNIQK